jgi:hypothetical protein
MGWKAVKDHYRIGHIVQVVEGQIWIGSPYISKIIAIERDGRITKRDTSNAALKRYMKEFEESPERLLELIQQPDTFEASMTVYTYEGGKIVEKQCEKLGWPNCTHDGELMYDNTYSVSREQTVDRAKRNAVAWINNLKSRVAECEEQLSRARADAAEWSENLRLLESLGVPGETCCGGCDIRTSCEFAYDKYNSDCVPKIDCLATK